MVDIWFHGLYRLDANFIYPTIYWHLLNNKGNRKCLNFPAGNTFPLLISTHAARFKLCVLNTLCMLVRIQTLNILTHSSAPFTFNLCTSLSMYVSYYLLLSLILSKLSSLLAIVYSSHVQRDVRFFNFCPPLAIGSYMCIVYVPTSLRTHVCELLMTKRVICMFVKKCDSVLQSLCTAGLRNEVRSSRHCIRL